jgi:hypothetical protein
MIAFDVACSVRSTRNTTKGTLAMTERNELLPAALAISLEPFDDDELDAALAVDSEDEPVHHTLDPYVPAPLRWEIEDGRAAEWAMRKLAACKVDLVARLREASWYSAQIDAWREQETKPLIRRANYFENLLADYAYRIRTESDAAVKTVSLPSGKIETRGKDDGGKIVLDDREAFMRWVEEVVPLFAEKLFARLEPRPITEIREHVKLVKVPAHRTVEFDDGCSIDVPLEGEPLDELEDDGVAVTCPVCSQPGRTVRYDDVISAHYRIEVDFDSEDPRMVEAATTAFFSQMTNRAVPGLGFEPNEISVTVKPHV